MSVRFVMCLVLSFTAINCADTRSAAVEVSVAAAEPAPTPVCEAGPVRVAVLQDKTESSVGNRTPQVGWEQLQTLLDIASECGGEIGFGIIHPKDMQPLTRVRLAPPPVRTGAPPPSANALDRRREARELKVLEEKNAQDEADWVDRQRPLIDAFAANVEPLLLFPVDGQRSAIWAGLRRALAFLSEPVVDGRAPRKYLLAATDGIDDARGQPFELPTDVALVIVSGSGSAGDLESLGGSRFESVDAACAFVARRATDRRVEQ